MKHQSLRRRIPRGALSQYGSKHPSPTVVIRRKHAKSIKTRLLRRIVSATIKLVFGTKDYELSVALLGEEEMTKINKIFLGHDGSTDVITFDYSNGNLCGEILICVDEAITQARAFRASWQSELVRYLIHGVLHLKGYTDKVAAARRKMQREEERLLQKMASIFDFRQL